MRSATASGLTPRAGSAGPASRLAKIAPNTATPTDPPSERNRFADAVVMPSSLRSTAFWIAIVSTCETMPKPRPNSTSSAATSPYAVSAPMPDSSASPTAISASPATGNAL